MDNKSDQKKEEEIKKKDKKPIDYVNILCYAGAVICFSLAILPWMLKVLDPKYGEERYVPTEEKDQAKREKLRCSKTVNDINYTYDVNVTSVYADSRVMRTEFKYTINILPESDITLADVLIPDYQLFQSIDSRGITSNETGNSRTIRIDYTLDEDLRKNTSLISHYKRMDLQKDYYTDNSGYECTVEEIE